MIDMSKLPAPAIIEPLDFEGVFAELAADFRERFPDFDALVESDPAIKLMEAFAYREVLLRARVNAAAKACMLAYAAGADLDNIAANFGVQRKEGESDADLRALKGSCALVVGSEGGFAPEEFAQAQAAGFAGVTLGKRILRAETACIAFTAAVMFCLGEWA